MITEYALIIRSGRVVGHRPYCGGKPILAYIGRDKDGNVAQRPRRQGDKGRHPNDNRICTPEEIACQTIRLGNLEASAYDDIGSGALDVWPDVPQPWDQWRGA